MIVVKIEPVRVPMKDGREAVVDGLALTDADPYRGYVQKQEPMRERWRANGYIRDNHPDRSLDTLSDEFKALEHALNILNPNRA